MFEKSDYFRLGAVAILSTIIGLWLGSLWINFNVGDINGPMLKILSFPPQEYFKYEPFVKTAYLITIAMLVIGIVAWFIFTLTFFLTGYGDAHFQSINEIKKNGLLSPLVEGGFVYGKLAEPPTDKKNKQLVIKSNSDAQIKSAKFISGDRVKFPQTMMVAPTRAGKGVGFVIPNVMLADGSVVVFDPKGEIFEATSRLRKKMGDEIVVFNPFSFKKGSHQYNPLARIARIENFAEQYTELQKLSENFLVTPGGKGGSMEGFVGSAREIFIHASLYAIEKGDPTFGNVSDIIHGDGLTLDKPEDRYARIAQNTELIAVAKVFNKYATMPERQRSSYTGVLDELGLKQWANPQIRHITQRDEISFEDIRTKRKSIYVIVNSDDVTSLNSILRLFFNDLIATLRRSPTTHEKSELNDVFAILDEFDQLGYMPQVVQAMKQLAGHGGRFTIITQSIPGLQVPSLYTHDEVSSLLAGCEVKLYISPNEEKTAEEIEASLGKRTGTKKSMSYQLSSGNSVSLSTEDRPLLSTNQIRRLPKNKILIMPEGHHPILADRIFYKDDDILGPLFRSQEGDYPYPKADILTNESAYKPKIEIVKKDMPESDNDKPVDKSLVKQTQKVFEKAFEGLPDKHREDLQRMLEGGV